MPRRERSRPKGKGDARKRRPSREPKVRGPVVAYHPCPKAARPAVAWLPGRRLSGLPVAPVWGSPVTPETAFALEQLRRRVNPASMRSSSSPRHDLVLAALRATSGWVRAAELAATMTGMNVRQVASALGGLAAQGRVERQEGKRGPLFRLPD